MTTQDLFCKIEERTFFAHHMLLHVAELEIKSAEVCELGRFNKCLTAMVMSALSVEALANAVGSRVAEDWPTFEKLRPHDKLDYLVKRLAITRNPYQEPWSTLQYLGGFRNDIAHPKPEAVTSSRVLPEAGLVKTAFDAPPSKLEREITLGNAKRGYVAVRTLKGLLTDALPVPDRTGIYVDMWHGSTGAYPQ